MFRGASDSAGKCIFNLLKAYNLLERKSVVERITAIKTTVNEGSGDSSGSDKVKSVTNTMVIAGSRKRGNSFGKYRLESKMNPRFLAKEVGGMGCVKVRESDELMILEVCFGSPKRRNSVL